MNVWGNKYVFFFLYSLLDPFLKKKKLCECVSDNIHIHIEKR